MFSWIDERKRASKEFEKKAGAQLQLQWRPANEYFDYYSCLRPALLERRYDFQAWRKKLTM